MEAKIIGQKHHPLGGFYVAQLADGRLLAGRSSQQARVFADAQAVYDHHHPIALTGAHWAWNICYLVQDLVGK